MTDPKPARISTKSSVSVELMLIFCSALFAGGGGVVWINNELSKVQLSLQEIHHRLTALEKGQNLLDRWTHTDMHAWTELLQVSNPDMKVPTVSK